MGEKYKSPSLDLSSPGDLHRRFLHFKQRCDLIFAGPLAAKNEDFKVRMLLLWSDDRALEIYNTATWAADADKLKLAPVWEKLEAYVKPMSNQILARFQLRCLQQGDVSLEEFVTQTRTLIDDGGYEQGHKAETLRDTLVFGIKSDKARRDAIAIGNDLTFQQVYDLAKTEESTEAQMDVITKKQSHDSNVHAVRSRGAQQQRRGGWDQERGSNNWDAQQSRQQQQQSRRQQDSRQAVQRSSTSRNTGGCYNCGGDHARDDRCPAKGTECYHCGKMGHFKRVCMQLRQQRRVHDIAREANDYSDGESSTKSSVIGTVTTVHAVRSSTPGSKHPDRIYAKVTLNDKYDTKLKVDTGSDACILTLDDWEKSGLASNVRIKSSNCVLHNYGGGVIQNVGTADLKITCRGRSLHTAFKIVKATGSPSIIGCRQSIELGLLTVNDVHQVTQGTRQQSTSQPEQDAATCHQQNIGHQQNSMTRESVLKAYGDCFDRIGRFPGDKYHIQLVDDAKPVVHPPRTVPVHIMPLYKAELDKMINDGIISPVQGPTDWVNSIVVNITETDQGRKVRLCLDPKDLNKNTKREHYVTRTIDEILPKLHGKKYFSVIDTKKGYWHVELDDESSLLTTFNTPFGRYKFNRLPFGL